MLIHWWWLTFICVWADLAFLRRFLAASKSSRFASRVYLSLCWWTARNQEKSIMSNDQDGLKEKHFPWLNDTNGMSREVLEIHRKVSFSRWFHQQEGKENNKTGAETTPVSWQRCLEILVLCGKLISFLITSSRICTLKSTNNESSKRRERRINSCEKSARKNVYLTTVV